MAKLKAEENCNVIKTFKNNMLQKKEKRNDLSRKKYM